MLLDIGFGIIIPITLSKIFGFEITNSYIVFGIIFSLLPDIDFIFYKIFSKKSGDQDHTHRSVLHYPIVYILIGSLTTYIFYPTLLSLFIICSLFHFIHDSIGIGWGVQWFAPFNKNYYQFFYTVNKNADRSIIYKYKPEELDSLAGEYGDKEWFKNVYLKFHLYSFVELLIFIISITLLLIIK